MSNLYQPSEISGTKYVRSYRVEAQNPMNGSPNITFAEQSVYLIDGGNYITQDLGNLNATLNEDNFDTSFAILDENGLPTEETKTYAYVFNLLKSLYIDLAVKRDNNNNVE